MSLIAYKLPPLVPRISGTGCSLWPTPNSTDGKGASQPEGRRPVCDDDLPSRVKMWPTPSAAKTTPNTVDPADVVNSKGEPLQPGEKPHDRRTGQPIQTALTDMVRLWPTPQARDHFPAHTPEAIAKQKAAGHGCSNLNDTIGGQLNPQFVSWLMGFPLDWCDMPGELQPECPTESTSCDV